MRIPWKVLSITLAAMLVAGSVAAQETPTPEPLTPVQLQAVQAFAADDILEGTSCSVEDCSGTVFRWEVAMWIIRLFKYQPTPHETFADVDSEQPYADSVETLYDEEHHCGVSPRSAAILSREANEPRADGGLRHPRLRPGRQ